MIDKHRISFSHVRLYAYFLNWRNSTETSHLRENKPAPKRRLSATYLPLYNLGISDFACFKSKMVQMLNNRFLSLSLEWTLFMRPFHLVCAYSTTPWHFLLSGFSNFLYLGILPGCLLFTGEWEVDVPVLKDCFNGAHFCTKTSHVGVQHP